MGFHIYPGDVSIGTRDIVMDRDHHVRRDILDRRLQVVVLLEGQQSFPVGANRITLDARHSPAALFMYLPQDTPSGVTWTARGRNRKVAVAVSPAWLEVLALPDPIRSTPRGEVRLRQWRPSAETVRLATQLLSPPPQYVGEQIGLFRMSRGLELLRRALDDALTDSTGDMTSAERIRLYILAHLDGDLRLEALELALAMNRRSLQRRFKAEFGLSLSDFIRSERLSRAYKALAEDGVTVASAAHSAGFSTPENFTTAFRRTYGITPVDLRNRAI